MTARLGQGRCGSGAPLVGSELDGPQPSRTCASRRSRPSWLAVNRRTCERCRRDPLRRAAPLPLCGSAPPELIGQSSREQILELIEVLVAERVATALAVHGHGDVSGNGD